MPTPAEFILSILPEDGSGVGNGRVQALLAKEGYVLTEADFLRERSALLQQRLISLGRGRGGSIRKFVPDECVALAPPQTKPRELCISTAGAHSDFSVMKISIEKNTVKLCNARKTSRGQFNTTGKSWLFTQVLAFISQKSFATVLDPFAGAGDLLNSCRALFPHAHFIGYDSDPELADSWALNDSLLSVPKHENAIIVTNPPYLAKHSAKRKGVLERVEHYYAVSGHGDLYQVAMDKCIESAERVVAIIPETVINSGIDLAHYRSITIILDDIFEDTEQPVVVVCIDRGWHSGPDIYEGEKRIGSLAELSRERIRPHGLHHIRFNEVGGQIGFRAVDMPDPLKPISFMPAVELGYDEAGIKSSSRLVTYVSVDRSLNHLIPMVCRIANEKLSEIRRRSNDVILSPFKGNIKSGNRRRRLDYDLARAILEFAISMVINQNIQNLPRQEVLFA